jgi:hypothetical protein
MQWNILQQAELTDWCHMKSSSSSDNKNAKCLTIFKEQGHCQAQPIKAREKSEASRVAPRGWSGRDHELPPLGPLPPPLFPAVASVHHRAKPVRCQQRRVFFYPLAGGPRGADLIRGRCGSGAMAPFWRGGPYARRRIRDGAGGGIVLRCWQLLLLGRRREGPNLGCSGPTVA